jgi:hypothetical protein
MKYSTKPWSVICDEYEASRKCIIDSIKTNEYTIELQFTVARNDSSEPEANSLDEKIDLSTKAINVKENTTTEEANEKPVVEENITTDNQQS